MVKIVRKQKPQDLLIDQKISTEDIVALMINNSAVLTEAVKNTIDITYDALGYTEISNIDLGMQYDHRVTWLHFNLDNLIWNLNEKLGYDKHTKYNHYTFKIAFSKINPLPGEQNFVWEFDGINFEIPRGITKQPGYYNIILMIEEYYGDENHGNVPDLEDYQERFVSAPIRGKVYPSIYDPQAEIIVPFEDSNQKASLIKPKIHCELTDNGVFITETKELGQKYDNYIRYLQFDPLKITAHLNDFNIFAIFRQEDKFFCSIFEQTNKNDPLDDYDEKYPLVAWVPTSVYQNEGKWQVAIIAFTGSIEDMNNLEEGNGDYYFYISKDIKMTVKANNLTYEDVTKIPDLSISSNLLSSNGEVITTKDDQIYQMKIGGSE